MNPSVGTCIHHADKGPIASLKYLLQAPATRTPSPMGNIPQNTVDIFPILLQALTRESSNRFTARRCS